MATFSYSNTLTNGETADADEVMENFEDVRDFVIDEVVHRDASVAFTGIPTLPATDPSTDNQAARKAYVDNTVSSAIAAHHDAASTDHDDRYYTETEINNRIATLIGNTASTGTAMKIARGTGSVVFSGNAVSAPSSAISTGLSAIASIQLTPIATGVVLAVNSASGGNFTVLGSTITDVDLSATVNFYWVAVGT